MKYNYDAELAAAVSFLPVVDISDPARLRAQLHTMAQGFQMGPAADTSALDVEDRFIAGLDGAPEVRVRVYTPKERSAAVPGVLYVHGGGFVLGSIELEHTISSAIATRLGIVLVSVEYRLAPEHPYPAGLDDCFAALQWLAANAVTLGVDQARIGVVGQSAGAGLCAGLTLRARDQGGPALCFQYLGMPELDDRLDTVSMRTFDDTPLWNRPNAILSWKHYLGEGYRPGGDGVPLYAAPARAGESDLRGLPPAYISAMEFDPLRDEGVLYALKLMQAGVPVELHTYPGTFHGSSMLADAAVTRRQMNEMFEVIGRGLRIA